MFPLKDNIPTTRFPIVTVTLILMCVAVFAYQLTLPTDTASTPELARAGVAESDQFIFDYGVIPEEVSHPGTYCAPVADPSSGAPAVGCGSQARAELVTGGQSQAPWYATVFTSMFIHGGWLHIIGNMLFLWIFGNNIEDSMGRGRFVLFYLLGGIAAVGAQVLVDPGSTVPTVGASGAIAGVLGGYLLLYPRARVLTAIFVVVFFTFVEIPAWIMLGVWFMLQFLPALGQFSADTAGGGGVAYVAHVGGFVFGLAAIRLFAKRVKPEPPPSAPALRVGWPG